MKTTQDFRVSIIIGEVTHASFNFADVFSKFRGIIIVSVGKVVNNIDNDSYFVKIAYVLLYYGEECKCDLNLPIQIRDRIFLDNEYNNAWDDLDQFIK
jgi:hypothetical protein